MKKLFRKWFCPKKVREEALFLAVEEGDFQKTKALLEKGASPHIRHQNWNWPLILSAAVHYPLLKLLLEHGADVNVHEENKFYSPLILAVRHGDLDCARLLLSHGADVHHESFAGLSALFYALEAGNEALIKLILEYETNSDYLKHVLALAQAKGLNMSPWRQLFDQKIKIS